MANTLAEYYKSKGQELPSLAQRTPTASKAGITDYTGTAEQNTQLLGYLQSNPSNDATITPDSLKNETKITTPEVKDTGTGVSSTVNNLLKTTQNNIAIDEKQQTEDTKALSDLIKSKGNINQADYYSKYDVNEKKKTVDSLNQQILQENNDLLDQIDNIEKNPLGKSAEALTYETNKAKTDSSRRLARLGIALSGASNDYTSAYNIATQQIEKDTNNLKSEIEARKFILEQAGTKLATKQAQVFQLQLKSLDYEKSMLDDAVKTATEGIKNGTVNSSDGYKAIQDLISGKISVSDYYAKLGVDTGSNVTGSDISGYNITSYATDPTHEQKVLSIYSSIPNITDANSAQSVIDSLSPNSPITGSMVYDSAEKYGVDAGLMISLMQQDSNLGTQGLAVKTKNAGNVGNDDAGNTKTYSSWSEGVDAVAKWLDNHRSEPKVSYAQYGLLANTTFNPDNDNDKMAKAYLDYYIKNSAIPSSYQLGMGRSTSSSVKYSNAQSRANELFFEATGYSLPDINTLKGYKTIINNNNKIMNNQAITAQTLEKNFDLAINGEITNDVNKNATIINKILNPVYLALGDPATAQALVSNGTITQEFANLISTRNAQGTLQADKMLAEELIPFGTSVEAQKAIVERLKQEAMNITGAVKNQNAELYKIIDPLQQLPENPNRVDPTQAKLTDYFTQLGMQDAGNNTLVIPRIQWTKLVNTHDEKSGLSQGDSLIQKLKDLKYTLVVQ